MNEEVFETAQAVIPLLRGAQSLTAVVFFIATYRALTARSGTSRLRIALLAWGIPLMLGALVLTYGGIPRGLVLTLFPIVTALSSALALASLPWRPMRDAMASLSDSEVRHLLAFRAVFGMFIVGGASAGLFPEGFAWTGGLGDLIVSWLASASPTSLDARGPKPMRILVHAVGVLDLMQVAFHIATLVLPWLRANDSPGPTAFLPWIGVPLMLALNLHGLRSALLETEKEAEPGLT